MKNPLSRTYARWERGVIQRFRDAMPASGDEGQRPGSSADAGNESELQHFRIETVTGDRADLLAALRSARRASRSRIPVVVANRDRSRPFVAIHLDDFLLLVAAWWAGTQPLVSESATGAAGEPEPAALKVDHAD